MGWPFAVCSDCHKAAFLMPGSYSLRSCGTKKRSGSGWADPSQSAEVAIRLLLKPLGILMSGSYCQRSFGTNRRSGSGWADPSQSAEVAKTPLRRDESSSNKISSLAQGATCIHQKMPMTLTKVSSKKRANHDRDADQHMLHALADHASTSHGSD